MCTTWGWAGDGASEFWVGCWLYSCRWGTAGIEPPAPSCAPGLWWVRAALSRYTHTHTLHLMWRSQKCAYNTKHNGNDWSHHLGLRVQTISRGGGWTTACSPNWRSWNPRDVRHCVHCPRNLHIRTNMHTEKDRKKGDMRKHTQNILQCTFV